MKNKAELLTDLMSALHDMKEHGKLPKEINDSEHRGFIECFDPTEILLNPDSLLI